MVRTSVVPAIKARRENMGDWVFIELAFIVRGNLDRRVFGALTLWPLLFMLQGWSCVCSKVTSACILVALRKTHMDRNAGFSCVLLKKVRAAHER